MVDGEFMHQTHYHVHMLIFLLQYSPPWLRWLHRNRVPASLVKRRSAGGWNAVALISTVVYLHNLKVAWDNTNVKKRHSFFLGVPTHPYFAKRHPLDHGSGPLPQEFDVLGDQLWINALAFDVLLSVLALACWSSTTRLDAESMIRCSILSGVDRIAEKIKSLPHHTFPERWEVGGLRGGATRRGTEYHLPDDQEAIADSDGEPPWIKRRSHRATQKRATRTQPREPEPVPLLGVPRRRGRPARSASSRAASQQPEEVGPVVLQDRRRSRSAGRQLSFPIKKIRSVSPSAHERARAASAVRRSARIRDRLLSNELELTEDERARRMLLDWPAFHERAGQAEQAGLTLALFAFGGLGLASAAVFGAEEMEVLEGRERVAESAGPMSFAGGLCSCRWSCQSRSPEVPISQVACVLDSFSTYLCRSRIGFGEIPGIAVEFFGLSIADVGMPQ